MPLPDGRLPTRGQLIRTTPPSLRRALRAAVGAAAVVAAAAIALPAQAASAATADATPGPDTTGVPAGTSLRVHTGDLVITTPGTVIDGLDIRGYVDVRAPGVVIRNSIIRGGDAGEATALVRSASSGASVTIVDSELTPTHRVPTIDGLRGWNITAERVDIHHVVDPVHLYGAGNVRIRDSWLHDNLHWENDPGWNGGPTHDDGIQIQSGSGFWITGNRIEGSHNAAIMITQDAGPVSNVMIRDNVLDDGACTVNIAQKDRAPFVNIDLVGNEFGDGSAYGCQLIRPTAGDITFSSNSLLALGSPIVVRR